MKLHYLHIEIIELLWSCIPTTSNKATRSHSFQWRVGDFQQLER